MEGTGEGCGLFCSPKLPQLSTISQQFCRRLQTRQTSLYIHKSYANLKLQNGSLCNFPDIISDHRKGFIGRAVTKSQGPGTFPGYYEREPRLLS